MGLSLADAAVRGTTFDQTIAEQKQSFLSAGDTQGLISLNHSLYGSATMMAKADDADDDADDDEDDDEDDSDDDDEDDDEDDEDDDDKGKAKKKKVDPRDVRITELSAEAKKKALAKDKPYLVKPKAKAKDDEDDEDEEPTRRRTGQPTRSRKKGNPNREKLVSKYPALRR
jgi:hypothetical protein